MVYIDKENWESTVVKDEIWEERKAWALIAELK